MGRWFTMTTHTIRRSFTRCWIWRKAWDMTGWSARSSPIPTPAQNPSGGVSPANLRKDFLISSKSLKKSRWSDSTFSTTATVGKKCRKLLQYSQDSRIRMHNVYNALAAAAAAYVLKIPGKAVRQGLEGFFGAGRRFEAKGRFHGAMVYDDYAHHPAPPATTSKEGRP